MTTPYEILGVAPTASDEDIRKAYRKLAKKFHPDINPEKGDAEERFKALNAANTLLADPVQRARYDRGEIDAQGQAQAQAYPSERSFYRDHAEGPAGHHYHGAESAGADDLEHIFADLFGRGGGGGARSAGARTGPGVRIRGGNLAMELEVSFIDAIKGAKRRVMMPDGRSLDVDLPAGLHDGATIRLKGQGLAGLGGGPPGDALIQTRVRPHPWFRRDGADITLDLPVTLGEAVGGAKVRAPTIEGPVMLSVPKGANTGTVLRLKGKGAPDPQTGRRGDLYVNLRVILPETPDPALEAFVRDWTPPADYDPRRGMEEGT